MPMIIIKERRLYDIKIYYINSKTFNNFNKLIKVAIKFIKKMFE